MIAQDDGREMIAQDDGREMIAQDDGRDLGPESACAVALAAALCHRVT